MKFSHHAFIQPKIDTMLIVIVVVVYGLLSFTIQLINLDADTVDGNISKFPGFGLGDKTFFLFLFSISDNKLFIMSENYQH